MNYKAVFLYCLLLFALCKVSIVNAQDTLTLEEAVRITLENNYNIKLVANELEISKNNTTIGNAGMLPSLNASVTNNNSIQNSRQTQANGDIRERNGARNSSLNAGVNLNWTVFDGFGMFARYDQLQEQQRLGEANLNSQILTSVIDVFNTYFNLVQQQQQLQANENSLEISAFRLKTAQSRFEIGKASRLEVLNAQVDLNTDTTDLLRRQAVYRKTQIQLNELLARDVNIHFNVTDKVALDDQLVLESLSQLSNQQNPAIQVALINMRIQELNMKQVRSERYPTLTLNSGYGLNESRSALGFATQTSGKGFNYGFTATMNIFNGLEQRRNGRTAAIQTQNAHLEYERVNQRIRAQLAAAYQTYQTNLVLAKMEGKNLKIAQQNLDITLEKFRLGSISPLEFRDAQLSYVNATVRYSNAQYEAKLAEIALKGIAGALNLQQ